MTKAEYTAAAFQVIIDMKAAAFLRDTVLSKTSCKDCYYGRYDGGGEWAGCRRSWPCLEVADKDGFYDLLCDTVGNTDALCRVLGSMCPQWMDRHNGFENGGWEDAEKFWPAIESKETMC